MGYIDIYKSFLNEFNITQNEITSDSIKVSDFTIFNLRDLLLELGTIYREDIDENTYIAKIKGGTLKKNEAIVLAVLDNLDLRIAIFAKEGIIKQKTSEGILNEIRKRIENKS